MRFHQPSLQRGEWPSLLPQPSHHCSLIKTAEAVGFSPAFNTQLKQGNEKVAHGNTYPKDQWFLLPARRLDEGILASYIRALPYRARLSTVALATLGICRRFSRLDTSLSPPSSFGR